MWPFTTKAAKAKPGATAGEPAWTTEAAAMIVASTYHDRPQWMTWNTDTAVKEGYKASVWVYSCVRALMNAASSVPWRAVQEDDEGGAQPLERSHPLNVLLRRPNAFMSWQDMMEILVSHLYLAGNGILYKVRVTGGIGELWPIRPNLVAPIPSKENYLKGYEYKNGDIRATWEPQDVAHLKFIDPSNDWWGVSPLMAAARVIDTDIEAVIFNKISMQNRGEPGAVISFKNNLNKEQYDAAKERVDNRTKGSANARNTLILGNEATYNRVSMTPAELDFIRSRGFNAVEICGAFRVPPVIVGLYESAALKVEVARQIFWLDTVIPLLDDIAESLNLTLAVEYGPDVKLQYDLANVQALHTVFAERVDTAVKLFGMGMPINAIIAKLRLGFNDVPGGDVGFIPSSMTPADAAAGAPQGDEL